MDPLTGAERSGQALAKLEIGFSEARIDSRWTGGGGLAASSDIVSRRGWYKKVEVEVEVEVERVD